MSTVEGWETHKINDICSVGRGRVISAKEIQNNLGIYPVYSSQSANNGEMGKIETFDFDGEYVTWTTDGAYAGTVFYRRGKFNCTNVCGTLASKNDNLSMPFLAYKLSTVAKNYVSYIGNPKLMNNVMAGIEILLPNSKPEQTKIAEILSCIDTAIEQTEAMIAKQQRIKTGLMQDLLSKGIDEHGNIRTEQTHAFKDSELGRIPVEWEVVPIENKVKEQVTYGIVQAGAYIENGIPYIRTGDMSGDELSPDGLLRTSEEIANSYKRSRVQEGDIVFSLRGVVGKVLLVPKSLDGANLTQGTARISPVKTVSNQYFLYAMRTNKVCEQILQVQKGTTFFEITLSALRNIHVAFPYCVQEQKKIAEIISSQEKSIKDLKDEVAKLKRQKTALMQDLLSGNVRVNQLIEN
jgi:type I restriction enzyme S subunit